MAPTSSFSVAQLFDAAAGPAAAAARSIPSQAGTLLYDAGIVGDGPGSGSGMTFDRMHPDSPHAQAWAAGAGEFYAATDVAALKFGDTDLEGGQYYCGHKGVKWDRYDDGQAAPGNIGGFHAAVIDTAQPGSAWVLSAKIVSINIMGMEMVCPSFVALSRADYAGFMSTPGDTQTDECRAHFKVQDLLLNTGRVLVSDVCSLTHDGRGLGSSGGNTQRHCARGAGAVGAPMDGYFPITLHRDSAGLVDCIRVTTC